MRKFLLAATALTLGAVAAEAATVTVTYEAPGVVNSTAGFDFLGIETFNSRPLGTQSFTTDFGTTGQQTEISGTYQNVQINAADVYGGAGGSNYAVTFTGAGYNVLNLTTNNVSGINYFGYWLSALDAGNKLELLSEGSVIFSFDPATVIAAVGACPNGANPYCGNPANPNGTGVNPGGNANEPYVFVNFFVDGGTIDQVRFFEDPQVGGYESDNHTVGFYIDQGGGTPVPEPGSLALILAGLAGLAGAARRRAR